MKKVVVVVVLLVLILGVAPWGVGKIAEGRVNKGLDKLVAEAPYLRIVERKWTGGWFRSEQEVTFELLGDWADAFKGLGKPTAAVDPASADVVAMRVADEAPQDPMPEAGADAAAGEPPADGEALAPAVMPPLRITVKNEIMHGPVLWTSGIGLAEVRTKFGMGEEFRKKLIEAFGTDEPVRVKTRVGLFGGGTTTFYGDGRSIKPDGADKTELSWDDFKLAMHYSGDLDSFSIKGKQSRIEVKDPSDGTHVILRDTVIDWDNERIVGDVYDTDFKMTVDEVTGTGADKKPFTLRGVHYILDTDKKGEFVDISADIGAGEFKSADLDQIGIKLKEIHYDFSFHRLHIDTLAKMSAKLKQSYASPLPVATGAPGAFQMAQLAVLKDDAIALFKHDPEIGIDRLGIVTAEGEGVAKGLIKFKGVTAEDFANPMMILGKLDVEITVEAPVKMVEKFPNGAASVGMAIEGGFAKREGDKLVCKIVYKAGALTVNGKPQALPFGPPPPGAGGEAPPIEADEVLPEAPAPKE